MLPKLFKPNNQYKLNRIGSDNDGGYLVEENSLKNSECLISFGLGFNWSFEKHFFKLKNCRIDCYDHTIKYSLIKKYSRKSIINFFKIKTFLNLDFYKRNFQEVLLYKDYKKFFSGKKNHYLAAIGIGKNKKSIKEVIESMKTHPIFFKIDIEGSEYRILKDLIKYQKLISGLVIEFHDIDLHREKIKKFIENFELKLCHIHGQNPGGNEYLDENGDPTQVEMTFTNSNNFISNIPEIPHPKDQPTDNRFGDVNLNFEK